MTNHLTYSQNYNTSVLFMTLFQSYDCYCTPTVIYPYNWSQEHCSTHTQRSLPPSHSSLGLLLICPSPTALSFWSSRYLMLEKKSRLCIPGCTAATRMWLPLCPTCLSTSCGKMQTVVKQQNGLLCHIASWCDSGGSGDTKMQLGLLEIWQLLSESVAMQGSNLL